MEALMKAINEIIEDRDTRITLIKWEKERLEKEVKELKKEIEELKGNIEKYKENEVNRNE
jgi:peptidoglycan hydrolase CwlO-like protein